MDTYNVNITFYNTRLHRLTKRLSRISFLRLSIFILFGSILIYLFSTQQIIPALIVFPVSVFCFGVAIGYYNKTAFQKKQAAFLKRINEDEILRKKCDLDGFDTGEKFADHNHPYTSDLDIFGQHSLFQLLNRTTTESGMNLLAEWLSEPASRAEILNRQQALKELSPKLKWRQEFQAAGMHYQNKSSDYKKLLAWVQKPLVMLKYQNLFIAIAISLGILSCLCLVFLIRKLNSPGGVFYVFVFLTVLFVNYLIIRKYKPVTEEIVETSQENLKTLKGYSSLIHKIESEHFSAAKLCRLQSMLKKDNYSAWNEINRLIRLLDFSQQKSIKKIPINGNYFYSILNSFLLLDIYLLIGTERWRVKNMPLLKQWASVVSEFEVLNSLAGFSFSNPSFAFPEISNHDNYVYFESAGHPLIPCDKRVCNDFHSEGHGEIAMITGSNMGGKSTFLRTVGVNIVLSLAGAPCCAVSARVSLLKLFSSMRTLDNLKSGISSFYAELKRIETMLQLIEDNQNVFFLLDEMFKGTNSEDRHKGGVSLIHQIRKLKTSGIIATHDIALAKLSGNKGLVTNYSFNSEIKDHSMIFSYKLHPEICSDFNASELMAKSGIKIIPDNMEERGK